MIPSQRINTGQTSIPKVLPPPVGGLNGRDPLAVMDARDAYYMDNIIPGTTECESRKGHEEFCAALGGPVLSLETYTGGAGDKLLAFANNKVFDISTGTAVQKATGKNSDIVIAAMFSNAADNAQHLLVTTGLDTPYYYDGSAIANLTITGITGSTSTLNYVFAFKGRVYLGQKDKLGFYYLGVGAIQGAANYFDLAQVSRKGGYLVAIGSYSQSDAGTGPNDYIVFITSKGEVIVYGGYDPSDADNFILVGRYFTGEPIGKKCLVNYGTDLLIITKEGAIPLSEVRRTGAKEGGVSTAKETALTSKLGKILSVLNANADVHGWCAITYSLAGWLVLNVPNTGALSGTYSHFIMNTLNNSWTRFTNWNGICFAVFNGRLYFGKYDGRVMLADEGRTDDGQPITIDCKQAYNYFDDGQGNFNFLTKHFQWAKLMVACDSTPPISAKFNVDYKERQPDYLTLMAADSGAEWDVAEWDLAEWGADEFTQYVQITLNVAGIAGSMWLRGSLDGLSFRWFATQYVYGKTKALLP